MKKKVLIISGFDTYAERVNYLKKYFSKEYEVKLLLTDFQHFHKEKIDRNKFNLDDTLFIDTKPYSKNISLNRIKSHFHFSKTVYNIINQEKFDLVYSLIPPNFLTFYLNKYSKKNQGVKVVADIIDLWPEAFPMNKFKNNPIFSIWSRIRNNNLKYIDQIVTECDYFKVKLPKKYLTKTSTIYLTRENSTVNLNYNETLERLDLCYLGSINNIIDLDFIVNICSKINESRNVKLHIIGDGEKLPVLIDKLKHNDINFETHGKIYDQRKKERIFNKCHYALNVMKEDVFVGLTMKSIDYFQYGIPLINTIKGDTTDIINHYGCGVNYDYSSSSIDEISEKILKFNNDEMSNMRIQSRKVFEELFTEEEFKKRLDRLVVKLGFE